ncbi:MAG: universal stress protein [Proteobacteria bacterium]|nr:universal stress protein [Pseudomonadota bacterium]
MHRFLVIFEDGSIREDALHYAVELTRRMDGSLSVLILNDSQSEYSEERHKWEFDTVVQKLSWEGIQGPADIRYGDKASELLKFIALAPSFHTLIWGGEDQVLKAQRSKKKGHWFAKVAKDVGCPIVTPVIKNLSKSAAKQQ